MKKFRFVKKSITARFIASRNLYDLDARHPLAATAITRAEIGFVAKRGLRAMIVDLAGGKDTHQFVGRGGEDARAGITLEGVDIGDKKNLRIVFAYFRVGGVFQRHPVRVTDGKNRRSVLDLGLADFLDRLGDFLRHGAVEADKRPVLAVRELLAANQLAGGEDLLFVEERAAGVLLIARRVAEYKAGIAKGNGAAGMRHLGDTVAGR